jgi:hypothetical protein
VNAAPHVWIGCAATLPKRGGAPEECEDRIAHAVMEGQFRAAIADGASASLMAGEWAEILARAFCAAEGSSLSAQSLARAGAAWRSRAHAADLPWHAVAKRERGAHAALVGVAVGAGGGWTAWAVGDSCVFQMRRDALVAAYPVSQAADFGRMPTLLATSGSTDESAAPIEGTWEAGDDLYLMSDALSEWFLREFEDDHEPWRWLKALETDARPLGLGPWIDELRTAARLRDDDIALLHLRLGPVP